MQKLIALLAENFSGNTLIVEPGVNSMVLVLFIPQRYQDSTRSRSECITLLKELVDECQYGVMVQFEDENRLYISNHRAS